MIRTLAVILALAGISTAQAQQTPPADNRAGYMIVMGTGTNQEAMAKYGKMLPAIYQKFGGYYLGVGGVGRGVTVLEGKYDPRSFLLARFPALDGPNSFWWSPEYRAAVEVRKGAGTFNVIKLKGRGPDEGKPTTKVAYLVGIAEVRDPAKIAEYGKLALPLVQAAGGKVIAGGARKDIELLEGEFGNKQVTVVQFADIAALRKFYNDPAYQKIIPIRTSGADYLVLELEGLPPA
jgi:uncharacterized protein (DUF1330 family)